MTNYTVTLNDRDKTDITVTVDESSQFVQRFGVIAAILDAARATDTYKTLSAEQDATIRSIWIDGEELTQF